MQQTWELLGRKCHGQISHTLLATNTYPAKKKVRKIIIFKSIFGMGYVSFLEANA